MILKFVSDLHNKNKNKIKKLKIIFVKNSIQSFVESLRYTLLLSVEQHGSTYATMGELKSLGGFYRFAEVYFT